jgi:hypothetical protein
MRVVVFVQENHTTDNYFRDLAPYGARVATGWRVSPNPPLSDHPHDRRAYFRWLTTGRANHVQFPTAAVLPFYLYLGTTGAFFENHCSQFGTGSLPNHLVLIGGQSPTLRNPPRGTTPQWDMPSVFGLAQDHRVAWRAYRPRKWLSGSLLQPAPRLAARRRGQPVRRRCGRGRPAAARLRLAFAALRRAPAGQRHDRHGSRVAISRCGGAGRCLGGHGVLPHL